NAFLPISQCFNSHKPRAYYINTKFFGCGVGQVNNSSFYERSMIIDAHNGFLSVSRMVNFDKHTEGERFMSCGHCIHIVLFATACLFFVEIFAIPTGHAGLHKPLVALKWFI